MNPSAKLLRVLYDPAAWADPAWFPCYGADTRWPRRLANRVLLREAGVRNVRADECAGARMTWLLAHWDQLPALAYLAGARLARDALASRNGLMSLRQNAAHFVALPMAVPVGGNPVERLCTFGTVVPCIHQMVMSIGSGCVRIAMDGVGGGWHDRIRLRLPPPGDLVAHAGAHTAYPLSEQKRSLRLLKFAASFNRAQNH